MSAMTDYLLLQSLRPNGPTRVTATVRPHRLAYLVAPGTPGLALAAIESACLTWDGVHQFLIPCPPGSRPSPVWERVLDAHDPDVLIDLVDADPVFATEQHDRWDRIIRSWDRPTETMEIEGATVFSSLERWRHVRAGGQSYETVNFDPLVDHELALPLAFRYGHLDQRPMSQEMVISLAYRANRIDNFVTVRTIDPRSLSNDDLIRAVTEIPRDPSFLTPKFGPAPVQQLRLPTLTTRLIPSLPEHYWYGDGDHPEHEQYDEAFNRRVVVVGDPRSVEDLCLVWNLRAQRSASSFLPVWVAPEWLSRSDVLQSLHNARRLVQGGPLEPDPSRTIQIVSASLDVAELEDLVPPGLANVTIHSRSNIDRFFKADFVLGLQTSNVVNFRDGVADITVPDYDSLGHWEHPERIGWTVAIEDRPFPRGSDRDFGLPPGGAFGRRIARDGVSGWFDVPFVQPESLWSVGVYDGWTFVEGLAKRAGYRADISEKGQLAIAVMNLLGDDQGLQLMASSLIYDLFRKMAEVHPRQAVQANITRLITEMAAPENQAALVDAVVEEVTRESQFDRQHWTSSRIQQELRGISQTTGNQVIEWLVERRVLLQGYEFTCPVCRLRRWYSIARLSVGQLCDGCQNTTTKPISTGTLTWSYRLNELFGHAVDQGILPHLLAVNNARAWISDERAPLLGLLPGVTLTPLVEGELQKIEVDLFAIKGGRVIIGECKASAGQLTQQEIDRFAELGRRLSCSRIVYAVASDLDRDADVIARAREVSSPMTVKTWSSQDLFASGTQAGQEGTAAAYLDTVLKGPRSSYPKPNF